MPIRPTTPPDSPTPKPVPDPAPGRPAEDPAPSKPPEVPDEPLPTPPKSPPDPIVASGSFAALSGRERRQNARWPISEAVRERSCFMP